MRWTWRCHGPPVSFVQTPSRISANTGLLVIQPVSFLTYPVPCRPLGSVASISHLHMGPFTVNTPGSFESFCTSSSNHESADHGCSCRKYLPAFSCFLYISILRCRCFSPFSLLCFRTSGGTLFLLIPCSLENASQGGPPVNK